MIADASVASNESSMPDFDPRYSPTDQAFIRFKAAIQSKDYETAKRSSRQFACLPPDHSALPLIANGLLTTDDQHLMASFARMSLAFAPDNQERWDGLVHRGIKAGRPDLMPPHWARDLMCDTAKLKDYLKNGDLVGAKRFVENPDVVANQYYMPEFRALKHFVRYNVDVDYRETFNKKCVIVLPITTTPHPETGLDWNAAILEDLSSVAGWSEKQDTVVPGKDLKGYPLQAEKRIRASRLNPNQFPNSITNWRTIIANRCMSYWAHLANNGLLKDLYGITSDRNLDVQYGITFHINEILKGPVLGPHYHSETASYSKSEFPFISAVFYPKTVAEDPIKRAGYLELGRPNFPTGFEPNTLAIRPVAGHLVLFPAFAFHGVIPIEESPRYSINIDFHVYPKGTRGQSIMGFYD